MLKSLLLQGAAAMGIPMTDGQAGQFETYHAMLAEANARMNLTRVPDDPAEAVDRNYLDCVAPLAIMLPDTRFTLVDALARRVEFLQAVIDRLGLNAVALHLRAEEAARQEALREGFDLAVARAVAPMNVLCEYMLPLLRVGGCMLALKGPGLDDELARAGNALSLLGGGISRVQSLPIPGRDWDHRAVWITKKAPTPQKYPRRAGMAEKRPL